MKKSICFFLREFPVFSQTFVIQQINGMIEQGHDVKIVTMFGGNAEMWGHAALSQHNLENRTLTLLNNDSKAKSKFRRILSICLSLPVLLFLNLEAFKFLVPTMNKIQKSGGFALVDELIFMNIQFRKNKISADTIIAHFGEVGVTAALLSKCGLLRGKLMTVFHGFELSEYEFFNRWSHWYVWLSKNSQRLLPISNKWKLKLENLGISKDKINVIHMGIDPTRFKFEPKTNFSNPIKLLTVGRAVEKKGIQYSIQGVAKSKASIEYHIIGGGPLMNELKDLVSNLSTNNKFVFHGEKPNEFVQSMLKETDIFVLTSVESASGDMEGIPVSLMEAMATGTIVLSTFHSGIPELIEHNISGFLVDERDAEAIASTLDEIARCSDLKTIQHAAKAKVSSEFNQQAINLQLSELIENLPV